MRPLVLAFALELLPSAMQGGADPGADAAAAGAAPAAADGAVAAVAADGAVAAGIQNNRSRGGPRNVVPSAVVSSSLNNRR